MIRKAIIVVCIVASIGSAKWWFIGDTWSTRYEFSKEFSIGVANGLLGVGYARDADFDLNPVASRKFSLLGASYERICLGRQHPSLVFVISVVEAPLWMIFLASSAYPTIAFIRGPLRRWRRRRKGLCLKCGYDLTGNVSGVCPECGTSV